MTLTEPLDYDPELPSTPGWVALSQAKKDWLMERTSNVRQFRKMAGIATISTAYELYLIEEGLKGEPMTMKSYLSHQFRRSAPTGWRMLKQFKLLLKNWNLSVIKALAQKGELLLAGASGSQLGEIVNLSKALPAPESQGAKAVETFIANDLREALRAGKSARSKGESALNKSDMAKIAANGLNRTLRATKLRTSVQKSEWLTEVVGWTMEANAIPGMIRAKRISLPPGVAVPRGRPRKTPAE